MSEYHIYDSMGARIGYVKITLQNNSIIKAFEEGRYALVPKTINLGEAQKNGGYTTELFEPTEFVEDNRARRRWVREHGSPAPNSWTQQQLWAALRLMDTGYFEYRPTQEIQIWPKNDTPWFIVKELEDQLKQFGH